jgi:L-ascorbate metabolism protein UlaG (beta-lactamase superfamily)
MEAIARRTLLAGALGIGACAGRTRVDPVEPRALSARAALRDVQPGGVGVYQVGHSTHVLALGTRRVLTDPWFGDPADTVFRHRFPLGLEPEEVGPVDVIAITHDHGDHFDLDALDRMDKSALVLVATDGMKAALKRIGYGEVEVLSDWQRGEARSLSIVATPAVHFGPEINFVLSEAGSPARVFFGGDTAWHDGLLRIGRELAPALAFLPVDGTRFGPRGHRVVMNAEEAIRAAHVLGARAVIATHCQDVVPSGVGRWLFPRPAGALSRFLRGCPEARFLLPGDTFLLG